MQKQETVLRKTKHLYQHCATHSSEQEHEMMQYFSVIKTLVQEMEG